MFLQHSICSASCKHGDSFLVIKSLKKYLLWNQNNVLYLEFFSWHWSVFPVPEEVNNFVDSSKESLKTINCLAVMFTQQYRLQLFVDTSKAKLNIILINGKVYSTIPVSCLRICFYTASLKTILFVNGNVYPTIIVTSLRRFF